jgi:Glycosyltransferase family 9 (heptosyltransferase)/TPR repeat
MAEVSLPTPDTLNRRGAELFLQGDYKGATLHYQTALSIDSNFYPAMANLVKVVGDHGNMEIARVLAKRMLAMYPRDGRQRINLGGILMRMERYEEALEELGRAKELCSDDATLWYNFALLHHRLGNEAEAFAALNKVEELGYSNHNTMNDRSHMMLAQGRNMHAALELYEARWHQMPHLPPWDYHVPEWKGEQLGGKTIMLHGEQGFGDTIMTMRFGRQVAALGASVVYCVPQALVTLLEAQSWADRVVGLESMTNMDGMDFHSPLYSAMRWLGVDWDTINPEPYLTVPRITGPHVRPGFNVGICWASGRREDEAMNWRRRISPLKSWLRLAEDPKVNLWSLQKGDEETEIAEIGAEVLVANLMPQVNDWAETTALIDQLDLVITVDTAIAHLAGALGKPVIMISQFCPCWRWIYLGNGTGQPWYSQMRIFKQPVPGDWDAPLVQAMEVMKCL